MQPTTEMPQLHPIPAVRALIANAHGQILILRRDTKACHMSVTQ